MLDSLVAGARADAQDRADRRSLAEVEALASVAPAPRDAVAALAPAAQIRVIAEIKRASPSKGPLASIGDPVELAREYQRGGAAAISVLTEQRKFGGSLADLTAVREGVDVPVLRKDFIVDEYQVVEARAAGADLVLLIVAALEQERLVALAELIREWGMTPLIEAHDANEVDRAVAAGAELLGINARNLSTFELDRDLFGSLVDRIPSGTIKIAESAVVTPDDVRHYRDAGADAVLVGEALVTDDDPAATLRRFIEA